MKTLPLGSSITAIRQPLIFLLLAASVGCSGSDRGGISSSTGGESTAGGTSIVGGAVATGSASSTAVASSMGGATARASSNSTGEVVTTGGTKSNGGTLAAGGAVNNGGTKATGGIAATGGLTTTGGAISTSVTTASGGANSTGGSSTAEGARSTGGANNAGGSSTTGGAMNTGGSKTTGGASHAGGAPGTGGTPATGGSSSTGTCGAIVPFDSAALANCSGTDPIECHFGGAVGNYEVSVQLGGGTVAGNTYIEAETTRRMLEPASTAAGQTQCYNFVVNVRQPEGQPIQAVAAGTPGLDLYFKGDAPQLKAIGYRLMSAPIVAYLAGDSTVCDQTDTSYAGWGQFLPQKFNDPISIANYADSGESAESFLGSTSLWGAIKSRMKTNDWVFIQFGHNDKDTAEATFRSAMTTMVNNTKSAGAKPILVTPPARIGYTLTEELVNNLGVDIPAVIRDLGNTLGVPVIDLTPTVWNWQQLIGSDWTTYYALGTDHTHTSQQGADIISGFVADAIRTQNIGLATYLR
jgi:lysophospholipase L1-like esterase